MELVFFEEVELPIGFQLLPDDFERGEEVAEEEDEVNDSQGTHLKNRYHQFYPSSYSPFCEETPSQLHPSSFCAEISSQLHPSS